MDKTKPALAVILSGVCWGVINIFAKRLAASGLTSLQISAIRMTIAFIVFTAVVLIKDRKLFRIDLRDVWIFACTGIISIVLFNTFYFHTAINSQASVAVVLLYTSPVFVMVLSAIIFKEKITARKIIALIFTVAGCVLVSGIAGGSYTLPPLVLMSGIASGFFYALYSIFGNIALEKYDTLTVTVWTFIFAFISAVSLGSPGKIVDAFVNEPVLILWGVGIGIISTVMPYFLYTWGLKRMEPTKAAILVAVEPVVGAVIGIFLFREPHDLLKITGIVFIITAIIILNFRVKKSNNL